ncbi:O-antigen ligase family protein [Halobacillus litoralis]|uniref:O-antigen ligase family protein n=1 Tax=Halobacillus litoralis TaxID=45668 RepID=UPI0024922048|nr:O-antigen ligase family protein [Halobacillus litoralis]
MNISKKTIEYNQNKKGGNNLIKIYLYLILFSIYLTPSLKFPGFPAIRIEEVLIILLILNLSVSILKNRPVKISWGSRQNLLLGFFFVVAVSIFNGTIKGYDTSVFDFNEFIKILKYLLIYTISVSVLHLNEDFEYEVKKITDLIFRLSIVLFLIVIQQYFNLLNLNPYYVPFIAPTHFETLVGGYPSPRPVGMIGNPNLLGFLFAITALLAIFQIISKKVNIKYVVILFMNILGMFLTLSRTSLVSFIVGSIIIILTNINLRNIAIFNLRKLYRLLILWLISISVIIYVWNNTSFIEEIFWRFESLNNLANDESWQARLLHWQENITLFKENPILGVGPLSRANLQFAADNEWLLLLRSFGIIGMIYFFLMFLVPYFNNNGKHYKVLSRSILIASSVYMIPAAVYNSLILMPLILIILSISDKPGKTINFKR